MQMQLQNFHIRRRVGVLTALIVWARGPDGDVGSELELATDVGNAAPAGSQDLCEEFHPEVFRI